MDETQVVVTDPEHVEVIRTFIAHYRRMRDHLWFGHRYGLEFIRDRTTHDDPLCFLFSQRTVFYYRCPGCPCSRGEPQNIMAGCNGSPWLKMRAAWRTWNDDKKQEKWKRFQTATDDEIHYLLGLIGAAEAKRPEAAVQSTV